jgi:hypothetical protein
MGTGPIAFGIGHDSGNVYETNFGQLSSSLYGANTYSSSAGGYFKYTPPAGFKALSTANLTATNALLVKGSNYFNAVTYTGTGAAQTNTSFNFEPGLLWIKDRTSANDHGLFGLGTSASTAATQLFWMEW